MKLVRYFNAFLKDTVNLNDSRIDYLDQRVESVTEFLKGHATFKDAFMATIPQGSYAHRTIIRPVQDCDEFDADLLLCLTEIDRWRAKDYVEQLYQAFRGSGVYHDLAGRRTRCVVLDYAGDFHLDVVPYIYRDGQKFITNSAEDRFELTNPEGFTDWLDGKNGITNGNLVKIIRLVKYLKNFKKTFSAKSFVLNALLGGRVSEAVLLQDSNAYHDVPTTLRSVMNALGTYLEANENLPSIMDPSGTGENLSDRWDNDGYRVFREKVKFYAKKIDTAFMETDRDKSLRLWQDVFGSDFKKPDEKSARSVIQDTVPHQNTEQKLENVGIKLALNPQYTVRIQGSVVKRDGFRSFDLAQNGGRVSVGRKIRFSIRACTVPQPYEVFWKVLNRGIEARRNDCIRGQIIKGDSVWERLEPTSFPGPHYVECYIVKNGHCVAKNRQQVIITATSKRAS